MSLNAPAPHPAPFARSLADALTADGLLAVLTIEQVEDAVALARALVAGGVRAMELTLRTPTALDCLKAIRGEVPEMVAGVGTVLTVDQLRAAQEADATFAVSPGLDPALVRAAAELQFSYAPGVMTPSEVQVAVAHGCRFLKFFPAETAGGLAQLRSMNAPFAHLGLRYIVLGGLTEAHIGSYLAEPTVAVFGGSWIAPADLIRRREWATIEQRARQARANVDAVRKPASPATH